jgi:predicted nucleic acid-binding protein
VTRYLLDTSTLVDVSKQHEPTRSRVRALLASGDDVGVCAVTIAEFMSGLPPRERPVWTRLFITLPGWRITRQAAQRAGYYRYSFARQGRQIETGDALIAATAWYWSAIVVTGNVKDFPMTDIQVVSFRI